MDKMKYEIEKNKMLEMFDYYYGFKILKSALDRIQSKLLNEYIYGILTVNNKACSIFKSVLNEDMKDEIYDLFLEFYLNELESRLIELEYRGKLVINISILELYKEEYSKEIDRSILEYWSCNSNKDILSKDRTFIKMFDEIHNAALIKYKDIFVKKPKNIKTLFRCQRGNHFENYKRMMPDKEFCGSNRFSEEGVPYLYLGCSYENNNNSFNQVMETCFKEVRLQNDCYATICRFRFVRNNLKLFNLYIDMEEREKAELKVQKRFDSEIKELINDNRIIDKAMKLKQNGNDKELKTFIQKKCNGIKSKKIIERMVSTQLINVIVQAIFEPVDGDLEKYKPFQVFAEYLKQKGYDGIIYKSTQMEKVNKNGMNLVLFDNAAIYEQGTMQVYYRSDDEYKRVK